MNNFSQVVQLLPHYSIFKRDSGVLQSSEKQTELVVMFHRAGDRCRYTTTFADVEIQTVYVCKGMKLTCI